MKTYNPNDVTLYYDGHRVESFTEESLNSKPYNTYIVDLCKTTEYTDNNGVTWWSDKYRGVPDVLKLYKGLEGQYMHGVFISEVYREDDIIKAKVQCIEDLTGYYINPYIVCTLTEDKHIESIEYDSISLAENLLSKEYGVEGLEPCRKVIEK